MIEKKDKPRIKDRLNSGTLILVLALIVIAAAVEAVTFLELTDTPDTYNNSAGKIPLVSDNESELVFGAIDCTNETEIVWSLLEGNNETVVWNLTYGGNESYEMDTC